MIKYIMITCPYCSEKIQDEAIKCRYCGEFLNKESKKEEKDIGHKYEINDVEIIEEGNKVKVDKKSKLLNILIYLVYIISSLIVAIMYTYVTKLDSVNSDPAKTVGKFIPIFLLILYLGIHYYRKRRGNLVGSFKENIKKMFKGLLSMVIVLVIFGTIVAGNMPSKNNNQGIKEIEKTMSSLQLSNDGTIDIGNIKDQEMNSRMGKAMQEYVVFAEKDTLEVQKMIENYENIIYGDDILKSKNNLTESLSNHTNLINYLEKYKNNGIDKALKEYDRLLGEFYDSTEIMDKVKSRNKTLIESRINMYKESLILYTFYYDNYTLLEVTEGEITVVDELIYDEYELKYTNYEKSANDFEETRLNIVKGAQDKLKNFNEKN